MAASCTNEGEGEVEEEVGGIVGIDEELDDIAVDGIGGGDKLVEVDLGGIVGSDEELNGEVELGIDEELDDNVAGGSSRCRSSCGGPSRRSLGGSSRRGG